MAKIVTFLSGKKTYLIGAIVFVIGGLEALGVKIPPELLTLLGGLGLLSLRAAVAKLQ